MIVREVKQKNEKVNEAADILELLRMNIIYCGELHISKTSTGKPDEGRYLIYLPKHMNLLWRTLHQSQNKVKVFIMLREADQKNS
jgi:hypothetical protein